MRKERYQKKDEVNSFPPIPTGKLNVRTGVGITDQARSGENYGNITPDLKKILTDDVVMATAVDGWNLGVKAPTAAYSDLGLMSVASPEGATAGATTLIYDADPKVQQVYWENHLRAMSALNKVISAPNHPLNKASVVSMGHHGRIHFSNIGGKKTPPSTRSIGPHHDHIMVIPNHLPGEAYTGKEWGLQHEREIMLARESTPSHKSRYNLPAHEQAINPYKLENLTAFLKDGFRQPIQLEKGQPHGYSFVVNNDPELLTQTLNEHFSAYKAALAACEDLERNFLGRNIASEELPRSIAIESKHGRIVQPSFTLYLIPQNNKIKVIVSPNLVAIGGPERAGILLSRNPNFPARVSGDDHNQAVEAVNEALSNSLVAEKSNRDNKLNPDDVVAWGLFINTLRQ